MLIEFIKQQLGLSDEDVSYADGVYTIAGVEIERQSERSVAITKGGTSLILPGHIDENGVATLEGFIDVIRIKATAMEDNSTQEAGNEA